MISVARQLQPPSRALCDNAAIAWRPTAVDEGRKSRPWGYETCALPNALSPRASRLDKRLRAWWRALRRSRCAWRTSWLQRHGAMHGTCCDTIGEVPRARC